MKVEFVQSLSLTQHNLVEPVVHYQNHTSRREAGNGVKLKSVVLVQLLVVQVVPNRDHLLVSHDLVFLAPVLRRSLHRVFINAGLRLELQAKIAGLYVNQTHLQRVLDSVLLHLQEGDGSQLRGNLIAK